MFHDLKTLLPQTLAKYKIASGTEATLICEQTNQLITDIIGQAAGANTKAVYFKDGTITIATDSSPVISELKLYTSAILETIADKFPGVAANGLRFIISNV